MCLECCCAGEESPIRGRSAVSPGLWIDSVLAPAAFALAHLPHNSPQGSLHPTHLLRSHSTQALQQPVCVRTAAPRFKLIICYAPYTWPSVARIAAALANIHCHPPAGALSLPRFPEIAQPSASSAASLSTALPNFLFALIVVNSTWVVIPHLSHLF